MKTSVDPWARPAHNPPPPRVAHPRVSRRSEGVLTGRFVALVAYCAAALIGSLFAATSASASDQVLYSLGLHSNESATPVYAGSVRAADGTVYGVAPGGQSALFKIASDGTYTNLHLFGIGTPSDGVTPYGTPLLASDGGLYGTTYNGGIGGCGTVYKYDIASGAYSVIYSFAGSPNSGCHPQSGVIEGADGDLWGTTQQGGNSQNQGTVYHVRKDGSSYVLVNRFGTTQGLNQGVNPLGPLTLGADGNYYGTLSSGGNSNGDGTVFKLTPAGVFTRLAFFTGSGASGTGANSQGGLAESATAGTFYGTTPSGGANNLGVIFRIVVPASGAGTLTRLYSFVNDSISGRGPLAGLAPGADGNFYGTTLYGGANGYGTVFMITPLGAYTTLYSFTDSISVTDGGYPYAGLTRGADNNFYGATYRGGFGDNGTIFRITPAGTLTTLLSLNTTREGINPDAELTQGTDGNFYGTTVSGGTRNYGTVFRLTPAGVWSLIYDFDNTNGYNPFAGLVQGSDGDFYGTVYYGGASNAGTAYKVSSAGVFTLLHSFTGATNDGGNPSGGLVQSSVDGNFYGVTYGGGSVGVGRFYSVTAGGVYTNLASFSSAVGVTPYGRLVQGADGNFYGTSYQGGTGNCGTVFRVVPVVNGAITSLHSYNCGSDGSSSLSGLTLGRDGNFYGMTGSGGAIGYGTIFRVSPTGSFAVLHDFNSTTGIVTGGALLQAGDGNFYGATSQGGTNGLGVLFRLTPQGAYTVLHSLAGAPTDGSSFQSSPIQASDGALYASTQSGGLFDRGAFIKVAGPADIVQNFAGTPSYGSVSLSWNASPRAVTYNVYQGSAAGAEGGVPVATGLTGTSTSITGLGNDNSYYFTVTAVNAVGETQPSNEVAVTIDGTPDAFSFTDVPAAPSRAKVLSNVVTLAGLNVSSPISVTGTGTPVYSINGGAFGNGAGTVGNGATVQVRNASPVAPGDSVTLTLTVGTYSTTWTVTTGTDTTPDAFSFGSVSNVAPGATVTSGARTITGINTATTVVSIGGDPSAQYSINGSAFGNAAGTSVSAGDSLRVRVTAGGPGTSTNVALNIGGTSGTLALTTQAVDTTPNAFTFANRSNVARSTVITSSAVTIYGINTPASVTLSGDPSALYSINGAAFTADPGTISSGQTVRVQVTTSASFSTATQATLTIGGVSGSFTATTLAADTTPNAFAFTDRTGTTPGTAVISNAVTISGINTAAAISISGDPSASYSVNSSPYASGSGTVNNNSSLRLRLVAPAAGTTTSVTVTVGTVTTTWSVGSAP